MIELSGRYATAICYTDNMDDSAISQIINLCNQPYTKDSHIRIMPDVHAGAGCTIGTTMLIEDKVCPNLVGVDIGCGMQLYKIQSESIDFAKLDEVVNSIPSGRSIWADEQNCPIPIEDIHAPVKISYAKRSYGTLGGGNHFIEVDKDNKGFHYLIIHSGSRHLGLEVAKHYQKQASTNREPLDELIDTLKSEGRHSEISEAIKELKRENPSIPKDLAYISGRVLDDYLHDINIAQSFASGNRKKIAQTIISKMGWECSWELETIHNYIELGKPNILRKGAVSAKDGEYLLIPINMAEGSLLCIGKGNPEWNYSAPHGAGRICSRGDAFKSQSLSSYVESMQGIYSTSVCQSTLDESPGCYKSISEITDNIGPTVEIVEHLKPVYNFKAK